MLRSSVIITPTEAQLLPQNLVDLSRQRRRRIRVYGVYNIMAYENAGAPAVIPALKGNKI